MQAAIQELNRRNEKEGLPRLEMGVAIHTGEVIVGNVGSERRTKYGVVGSAVNHAGRIESFTVGGQILISDATLRESGDGVRVGSRRHRRQGGTGSGSSCTTSAASARRGCRGPGRNDPPGPAERAVPRRWTASAVRLRRLGAAAGGARGPQAPLVARSVRALWNLAGNPAPGQSSRGSPRGQCHVSASGSVWISSGRSRPRSRPGCAG